MSKMFEQVKRDYTITIEELAEANCRAEKVQLWEKASALFADACYILRGYTPDEVMELLAE